MLSPPVLLLCDTQQVKRKGHLANLLRRSRLIGGENIYKAIMDGELAALAWRTAKRGKTIIWVLFSIGERICPDIAVSVAGMHGSWCFRKSRNNTKLSLRQKRFNVCYSTLYLECDPTYVLAWLHQPPPAGNLELRTGIIESFQFQSTTSSGNWALLMMDESSHQPTVCWGRNVYGVMYNDIRCPSVLRGSWYW